MERKTIAVIGLSTIEFVGIKSMMHQLWEGNIVHFPALNFIVEDPDKYAGYIISSDGYILNRDFFRSRKQKTLIIIKDTDCNFDESKRDLIADQWDAVEIIHILSKFIDDIDMKSSLPGELSHREIEVLKMVATGLINKEIADKLCISVNTVITHRKNISAKLGVKSASALTIYAIMNGLI